MRSFSDDDMDRKYLTFTSEHILLFLNRIQGKIWMLRLAKR